MEDCGGPFQLVPFLDRVKKLIIGNSYFRTCYHLIINKYARNGTLKDLLIDFSISNGAFLADPYADAELNSDGSLKVYWRSRRETTKPSMSVKWIFNCDQQSVIFSGGDGHPCTKTCSTSDFSKPHLRAGSSRAHWNPCYDDDEKVIKPPIHAPVSHLLPFGHIFDGERLAFEMTKSPIFPNRYIMYRSTDSSNSPKIPFLEIVGKKSMKAWAAKTADTAVASKIFRVYDKRNLVTRNCLIATLEPVIGGIIFQTDKNIDGLMVIRYRSLQDCREVKAAILGAALLLCLRHYMKELYNALQCDAAAISTKNATRSL